MEESTSTDHDIVQVITGQYLQDIKPLTADQYARLIFEALKLIKRQLRYVGRFEQLPTMTAVENVPPWSWMIGEAKYRELVTKKGLEKQSGLNGRVVTLCKLESILSGHKIDFRVFLTQSGQLKIVKHWTVSRWPEESEDCVEILPSKTSQQLAEFLNTEPLELDDYNAFRREHETPGNVGLWILNSLMHTIWSQEDQMRKRLEPFTESRQTLARWLDQAKSSHNK